MHVGKAVGHNHGAENIFLHCGSDRPVVLPPMGDIYRCVEWAYVQALMEDKDLFS